MVQAGIFLAVTVGSLTLFRVLSGLWQPDRGRIRRRLAGEFGGAGGGAAGPGPLYKDVAALDHEFRDYESRYPVTDEGAAAPPPATGWRGRLEDLLRQAGVTWTARQLLYVTCGAAAVLGVVGACFGGPGAGLAAGAAGAVVPPVVLYVKRAARRERYLKQLVGAFELMARVLRSGQAVPESFRAAVDTFGEPLAGEFGGCLHQIEHGIRPEAAFRELSQRSGILELRIFVVAMMIQRQTGGNLSEVLDRLAAVIRARLRLRQKLRSLTAEGRLQSLTLTILPVVIFGVMYFINRQYAEVLLAHGKLLLATAACMGVGVVWIRNIMNFEG